MGWTSGCFLGSRRADLDHSEIKRIGSRCIQMPRIYCDHNFLINALNEDDVYKERLREARNTHDVHLVLSTWHWVEMAKDENTNRGLELADFADSLNPSWLRERRRIQA